MQLAASGSFRIGPAQTLALQISLQRWHQLYNLPSSAWLLLLSVRTSFGIITLTLIWRPYVMQYYRRCCQCSSNWVGRDLTRGVACIAARWSSYAARYRSKTWCCEANMARSGSGDVSRGESHRFETLPCLPEVQCQIGEKCSSATTPNSLNGGGKQVDCRSRWEGVGWREELEEDVHMTGTTSKVSRKRARMGIVEPEWALYASLRAVLYSTCCTSRSQ